ncbi:MAG: carboxypeptidase regulatory-like domain-containing protein, partial [Blastocatellia bacterium]|nr:carboxypeptidase regulatory-like domain-containing protein [Blastocatellia bacterium]
MYKKILASGWQSMLLAALLFLYGVGIAWAQAGATSASITGKITEQSGTAISGATVKIIDLTKNLDREITTDTEGNYSAQQLTPGFYEVKVSADGFQSKTTRFELSLGTTARLDISLAVGAVSEVIEVNASTSFNEGKTESSNNVDTRRIGALPINRRTFLDFALTSARTVADRLPSQGVSGTSGLSFNGQAGRYNIISIDGVDNT